MPIDVEEWDHLLVATPSEPLFSKTPSPKKEAEKPKTWKMSMIEAMIAEDKTDAAAEAAASQLMLRMAVDHEPEEQQEELELDDDEKAWIKDSEVSERVWLSEQKMIGKSLKLHGRAGMKTAARWVNKRAKINVGDLDEAAHKSDDESAGLAQGTRALLLLALVALRLRRCERVDVASCVEDLSV